ncbi:hypothetical protein C1Y40_05340 [Mycobacterium talmoniae]|uniref:Uncharacterized protein n=1 Tax=Mycobacterium talmoniae TaxID=1858794 RepID=A0A2S8BCW2_9MYCO|nr:hypothetical protein C1Y40_05340 [Mycobacterium talmoniae]
MAPAINRPITHSNSTSPALNSRRSTVCTLSTPTSPPGSVSIGTDTIEVKSRPRSDWIGRYRGSASLSSVITTGSRCRATHPDTPEPSGNRILPTWPSNGGVAPASVSERSVSSSTCTKQTSVPVAAVMIRAAAAASGSTPGPLEAAWMSSRSNTSSWSASTKSRTALDRRRALTGRSLRAARWPPPRSGR